MKIYNGKEVREILKIAAENSSIDDPDNQMGLTIDELRQLASETGIDPDKISMAAAEVETRSGTNERSFFGGPFSYNAQVIVKGEINVALWEEMLLSIRDFFHSKGKVSVRPSVYEWSSPWGTTNSAHVTALRNNGNTTINVGWSGPLTALPYYIPVPLVAIASLFLASGFLELTAIPGLTFTLLATGLAFLAGRWRLRKSLDKGFKKLQKMVSGLEEIASRKYPESESEKKRVDEMYIQSDFENPLKNILMDEDPDKANSTKSSRNRSKT